MRWGSAPRRSFDPVVWATREPGCRNRVRSALPDARFRGYDPIVPHELTASFGLDPVDRLEAAFDGTDLAIIHTNHPNFAQMPLGELAKRMRTPGIIYDFWNLFIEPGVV